MTRDKPEETGDDRDKKTGRFVAGNRIGELGGRPRGYDFRRLVLERSRKEDVSIEDALWLVFRSLLKEVGKGNVQAAKLLLDKLCDADAVEVNVNHTALSPEERQKRISELLDTAARRRAGENHGGQRTDDGKRGRASKARRSK